MLPAFFRSYFCGSALLLASVTPGSAAIIATWTFETSPPADVSGSAITALAADVGTGTASGFHSATATAYSTPAGNGSANSLSSNNWGVGDYYQFVVDTTGLSDIAVTWDQTRSSTGPSAFEVQYSTNGTDFDTAASVTVAQVTWASGTAAAGSSYSVSFVELPEVDNVPALTLRLVQTASGVTATGTNRVDNFSVATVPEPATGLLAVGSLWMMLGRRRR